MGRYQGMDPGAAFAVFYEANKDRCLRTVVAGGTDPATAEEAVAEAFARAWAAWPKVSRHPTPVAWVVRVALNHHVSRWRRQRREVSLSDDHTGGLVAHDTDPPGREDLTSALAELPERQRQVVALRIFLDLDTANGVPAGSGVPVVLARFRSGRLTCRFASLDPSGCLFGDSRSRFTIRD